MTSDIPGHLRFSAIRSGEATKVALALVAFFLLLFSYYILRPVRDEMGVQTGVGRLQWLFTGTFAATLLTVPLFGWVVARVPRRLLVPDSAVADATVPFVAMPASVRPRCKAWSVRRASAR